MQYYRIYFWEKIKLHTDLAIVVCLREILRLKIIGQQLANIDLEKEQF